MYSVMTNRVPPSPGAPLYAPRRRAPAARPTSPCAPRPHAQPPRRRTMPDPPPGLLSTLSRSPTEARHHHRGPPLPAGMRAAVHTRDTCRHQASCDGARAQPTSPLCGLGRRVHTCGRGSPSRLRRPALLLHAARRVPAPSTLHAALYTARAHPTAPYGAIPLPNKRCK